MWKRIVLICVTLLFIFVACTQNMDVTQPDSFPAQSIMPSVDIASPSVSEAVIAQEEDEIDPAIKNYDWASHPFYANMEPSRRGFIVQEIKDYYNYFIPGQSDDPMAICNLFPDPFFARKVGKLFDKDTTETVTFEELAGYSGGLELGPPQSSIEGIRYFTGLTYLGIGKNYIPEIPDEIEYCKNLRAIRLVKAYGLTSISSKIGELEKLEWFFADMSDLGAIPTSLCNLKSLRVLSLSNCGISSLPEEIGNLKNLEYLDILRTRITKLPDGVTKLSNLRFLNIGHNDIKKIPKNMGDLKNLEVFLSFNCDLKKLPDSIKNLKKLSVLNVYDNYNLDEDYKKYIAEDVYTCKNPGISDEIYEEFWTFLDSIGS